MMCDGDALSLIGRIYFPRPVSSGSAPATSSAWFSAISSDESMPERLLIDSCFSQAAAVTMRSDRSLKYVHDSVFPRPRRFSPHHGKNWSVRIRTARNAGFAGANPVVQKQVILMGLDHAATGTGRHHHIVKRLKPVQRFPRKCKRCRTVSGVTGL